MMIDPSFVDITDEELAQKSPYPMTMQELEVKYRDLENKLAMKTQQWEFAVEQVRKYDAQVDSFESALKRNEWDFDGDTLIDLASFFDITLEREYMVEITVKFSGNVTVPMDYDMDDLENELSAEITKSYYGDANVEVDFTEEGMEISYEEV
jgi:hypothetical protein